MAEIKKLRVVMVGVGAVGSFLLDFLKNSPWVEPLIIIDDDRVESKNIPGQCHDITSVGKSKVQSLARRIYSETKKKVEPVNVRLTAENCHMLLTPAALIVDCTDNYQTRLIIRSTGELHKIPTLHVGIDAFGQTGVVVWGDDFEPDKEGGEGVTCENGENRAHHALVAAMAFKVMKIFAETGKRYQVDVFGLTSKSQGATAGIFG